MLVTSTYIDKSPIHGIGLFAAESASKGTILWEFNPIIDRVISKDELADLPKPVQEWLVRYAWQEDGHLHIGIDNDKFINHSSDPNGGGDDPFIALRDIEVGEEITADYRTFSESEFSKSLA